MESEQFSVRETFTGKTLLVTGCTGFLGNKNLFYNSNEYR